MQARLKLKPGQKGTKKLLTQYGPRLLCVRYRYDEARQCRYKTVELIVEETVWTPTPKPDEVVGLRIHREEIELWQQVKQAGGIWHAGEQVWKLRYEKVRECGLEARIVRTKASNTRNRT